tara:strand:- start:60 stop:212 length:153 start_codon:yes stop_codon:yes gene_type:complete
MDLPWDCPLNFKVNWAVSFLGLLTMVLRGNNDQAYNIYSIKKGVNYERYY